MYDVFIELNPCNYSKITCNNLVWEITQIYVAVWYIYKE